MHPPVLLAMALAAFPSGPSTPALAAVEPRITILYDAFGGGAGLRQDWGFAALIEYGGHRILFDTGDDPAIFEQNVRALQVDLRRIDFAVISHRHGDHIAGLSYLLRVNPHVPVYAPRENFGVFGWSLPGTFYRRDTLLPREMRYFDGEPRPTLHFGTAWPKANFKLVDSLTEVLPGISLVPTVSSTPGTLELHELSLVIRTPAGALVVVGCTHPGIETILEAARAVTPKVALIVGGLHWVTLPDGEIARLTTALHDTYRARQLAPGHCTGEPGLAALRSRFGSAYLYAGLGSVLEGDPENPGSWRSRAPRPMD